MSAPVRKGTKNPALLLPRSESPAEADAVYVVGLKPIRHHGEMLAPGTVVPDAHEWPRLESKLRARTIVQK